jgi:hypothetical protein
MSSIAGLIGQAMGGAAKGYGEYARQRMDIDLKKEMMDAEEAKQLRIDAIRRERDLADIPKKAKAETDAYATNLPTRAAADAAAAPVRAGGEAAAQVKKTETPGYLGSVTKETSAKETSGSRAQGAAASYQLGRAQRVDALRDELVKTDDENRRQEIQRQITDLSPGSTRSYSDMVTAANNYRMMAQNLRKDAEAALTEEDRVDILDRARRYEMEADSILRTTTSRRLGNRQDGQGQGQAAAAPKGKPWERQWSTPSPRGNTNDNPAP